MFKTGQRVFSFFYCMFMVSSSYIFAHVALFFSYAFLVRSSNCMVEPTQVVYIKNFNTRISTYAPKKKKKRKNKTISMNHSSISNTIQYHITSYLPIQALPFFQGVAQWYNRLNGARIARKLRQAIEYPRSQALLS